MKLNNDSIGKIQKQRLKLALKQNLKLKVLVLSFIFESLNENKKYQFWITQK